MVGNKEPQQLHRIRPDLVAITHLVAAGASVLDLGCGDGMLLQHLVKQRAVVGRGIEISETGVLACVSRGLSVRQGKLEEGLADYPPNRFDVVILSQTLPFLNDPVMILREMLRVGRRAIVSFPNWGYWRSRFGLLLSGRMPAMPDLDVHWYDAPRWQAFTISDFVRLCREHQMAIEREIFLAGHHRLRTDFWPNLRASTAIFSLHRPRSSG